MRDFDCEDCQIQHEAETDLKPLGDLAERGLGGGKKTGVTAGSSGDENRGQDVKDAKLSDDDDDGAAVYVW